MRLSTKLLLILEGLLLALVIAMLLPLRRGLQAQVTEDVQRELLAIAATAALHLDGDLHQQVQFSRDPDSPEFQTLRDELMKIREVNGLTADNLYTYYLGQRGELHFGVMTHDRPFVGDHYGTKPHQQAALINNRAVASELYEDVNGQWISAAAPIHDAANRPVGLLEVTQPAAEYFARTNRLAAANVTIGLVGLAGSSILGYLVLSRLVIRPVRRIHDGLDALGRHDFTHRVRLDTGDEFQELAEALNILADQLNVAQSIQAGFFPTTLPEPAGYRMAGLSVPCDATGGDYYDAFALAGNRTAVAMADVTGHGLGPSLLMATCRATLHALARTGVEPDELLQQLEERLKPDLTDGRFITMVLGVLHPDGRFVYANAGHGPALARINGNVAHLDSHRPPLGVIIPIEPDPQTTVQLNPGDRILLTSDGVNEAQDPDNRQFGLDPLSDLLRDDRSACTELVATLNDAVTTHRAGRRATDDVTILCIDCIPAAEHDTPQTSSS